MAPTAPHPYLSTLHLVQACHRRLMDAVEDQLARNGREDVTAVQALLLFNLGDQELAPGELYARGCYFGTNASYNLKKLIENCFIDHQRSRVDKRRASIKLIKAGHEVRDLVAAIFDAHARTIAAVGGMPVAELSALNATLARLERFWTDHVRYRL